MQPTLMGQAIAAIYGYTRPGVHSATWLWFEWKRGPNGQLTYKWKW